MARVLSPWTRVGFEFVVIVLGVLVALAVDQWAGDRRDRASESEYLRALATDLRNDSVLFAVALTPMAARAEEAMAAIGPVIRGGAPVPEDTLRFLRQIVHSTGAFTYLGDRTTFDELLATGSLRLIESAQIRSSLVSYYETKSGLLNFTAYRASGYAEIVRSYLPGDPYLAEPSEAELRTFGVGRAIDALGSPELVDAMNRHINYLAFMRPNLAYVATTANTLLADVSAEAQEVR